MLIGRYSDPLYRHAVGMTGSPDDAADILQNSFIKAYQHLGEVRGRFDAWVFRIVANGCKDWLKNIRRTHLSYEEDDQPSGFETPEAELDRGELRGDLDQALSALPASLQERLVRECARLTLVEEQLAQLEKTLPEQLPEAVRQRMVQLMQLKAVGPVGAQRLLLELFWRQFNNRREVGACVGLVPQPYDSGESRVDQGISKAGNRRVRALLIEMAWMWLRWQPHSELAHWFAQRTRGSGSNKRSKRIAIVAVARRLAILLWRYLKHGVLPEGVQLKPAKVTLKAA